MITLSTGSLYPYSLGRIFRAASLAGFDGVELMLRNEGDNAYWDSWDIEYLKGLEKNIKLKLILSIAISVLAIIRMIMKEFIISQRR